MPTRECRHVHALMGYSQSPPTSFAAAEAFSQRTTALNNNSPLSISLTGNGSTYWTNRPSMWAFDGSSSRRCSRSTPCGSSTSTDGSSSPTDLASIFSTISSASSHHKWIQNRKARCSLRRSRRNTAPLPAVCPNLNFGTSAPRRRGSRLP